MQRNSDVGKNCLGCHFLCVYADDTFQRPWRRSLTRKECLKIMEERSFYSIQNLLTDYRTFLCCGKGVWDENEFVSVINKKISVSQFSFEETEKLRGMLWLAIVSIERNDKNPRGNSCFYREFQMGMSLPAAEGLEKRETIQKEAAADRKWLRWGVWATFATAAATLIAVVLQYFLT